MDETVAQPTTIDGAGKANCPNCRAARYRALFGSLQVDVCEPHLAKLRELGEEHPERIITYDAGTGVFSYTIGVKAGWDDKGTPGDHDEPYYFGRTMHEERFGGVRFKLALVKLRSDIQNQRIDAHSPNRDGF